jgi:hypothetical protein
MLHFEEHWIIKSLHWPLMPQKTKRVRFLQGVLCALLATIAALHEQACPVQLLTMASFSKALFCAWALRHKHSDPKIIWKTASDQAHALKVSEGHVVIFYYGIISDYNNPMGQDCSAVILKHYNIRIAQTRP